MDICFGENAKRLRKEKGLTQEALADYLGVSFQTVSKWEREESYPDISLLPVISSFFGVSVDDLLGVDKARNEERKKRYIDLFDNMKSKDVPLVLSEFRKAVRDFPNEYPILVRYMELLLISGENGTETYHDSMISAYEKIQKKCTDDAIRIRSKRVMIEYLMRQYQCGGFDEDNLRQAEKIADGLPSVRDSREIVLPELDFDSRDFDRTKWNENRKRAIEELSYLLQNAIISYCYYDSGFSSEYKIEVINNMNGILRLTDTEDRPSKNRIHFIYNCGHLGHLYTETGDNEKAIYYLRLAAEQAARFDSLPEVERTALFYERDKRISGMSMKERMYELMTEHYPLTDEFRKTPGFQEILDLLR